MAGAVRDGRAEVRIIRERVTDGDRDAATREIGFEPPRAGQFGRERDESQRRAGAVEDRGALGRVIGTDAVRRLRARGLGPDPRTFEVDADRHGARPVTFGECGRRVRSMRRRSSAAGQATVVARNAVTP